VKGIPVVDVNTDTYAEKSGSSTAPVAGFSYVGAVDEMIRNASSPAVARWLTEEFKPEAQVMEAAGVMKAARQRIAEAQARGEDPLPPIDRANLPQTESEAVEYLMNRLGMSEAEKQTVRIGVEAMLAGATPSRVIRQPIGGHSKNYANTHRTQMAITDPGLDHIAMTLADPSMMRAGWVHMEIINRPNQHTAPYANPGYESLALVRMLLSDDAPATAFFGRPNYIASTIQDTIEGTDIASAAIANNLDTTAHTMVNSARAALNLGYSEAKFGMDGLGDLEVAELGRRVHAQANLQEGEYISAAFNLLSVLRDFKLLPLEETRIVGAPTERQRHQMLRGAQMALDAAHAGGFKKVTVDSASMTPPSYPLIEFFGVENLLDWTHSAQERGMETYGSGGMRDYHFPLLQFVGLDGVGVGFSIHDPPQAGAPGIAGRLLPERVKSAADLRDAAEQAPVGRLSVLRRMLDERASDRAKDGTQASGEESQLRDTVLTALKEMARGIDHDLDAARETRDTAIAAAANLPDEERKPAEDAAKKAFETTFKTLIQDNLSKPENVARANELLAQGQTLGVIA
jgi:hypothetical protein